MAGKENTRQSHDTLASAQLAVMEEVPYVQKKSAKGLNYTFAGEADLIASLRPAMIRHGITVRPSGVVAEELAEYATKSGTRMASIVSRHRFVFTQVDCGKEVEVEVLGEAADSGDKRSPKAATIAMKYALRQFFLIETGDDPDELVGERGDASEGFFKRCATSVAQMRKPEELDKLESDLREGATGHTFDEGQVKKMIALIEKRRNQIGK